MGKRWIATAARLTVALALAASFAFAQGSGTEERGQAAPLGSASSSASPAASAAPIASVSNSAQAPPSAPPEESLLDATEPGKILDEESAEQVGPRLRYTLESVEIRGNSRTTDRVVRRYVKLRAGDILDVDNPELELTRFRLLGTGYFRSVDLSLRKGARRGQVILVVHVTERNTLIVGDLWMGLSADADTKGNARPLTAYAGVDVAETNLAGTGITVGAAMGVAQQQLALRTRFFDPSFLGSQWMTQATLVYNDARDFFGNRDVLYDDPSNATERVQDYAILRYKRFGGILGIGHDLGVPVQAWLDYRLERLDATLPLAASHRRGLDIEPIDFGMNRGLSILSTMRGTLVFDTRDSPILPTKGWHTTLAADVSLAPLAWSYPYQKVSVNASKWWRLPHDHVFRLNVFGGAIAGYAPLYERYYVGDFSDLLPDRMLDLNTDRRPPPNFLNTSIVEVRYGHYAAKIMGEYRIPLYRGRRSVYGVDVFGAGGIYSVVTQQDINDPPRGYSGLARIPVDLTFNLGLRIDTSAGGFVFGVSSMLGFIPVRGEAGP